MGTMDDLLASVASENGKALNAFDCPLLEPGHPPLSMSSDMTAWNVVLDNSETEFPTHANRWGLAATAGAHRQMHTDANGFATYVQVKTGMELWIVARPREFNYAEFSIILNLVDLHHANGLIPDSYLLEAILLMPGSQLYVDLYGIMDCLITLPPAICVLAHLML